MKILIIDDHALFREGLRLILNRLGSDLNVLEAGSAEIGLTLIPDAGRGVDLILLDLNLPGLCGAESVRTFRRSAPTCPIVMLSGTDEQQVIRDGMEAGAQGFIHKSSTSDEMVSVMRGALDWQLMARLSPGVVKSSPVLTLRQREVLARLCEGGSNKQIARDLGMSDHTVRVHLYDIFRLMDVKTRTQAAMLAKKCGVV